MKKKEKKQTKIKKEEINSFKKLEEYVLQKLKKEEDFKFESIKTGTKKKCNTKKICYYYVDIEGKYKNKIFVIDTKYYLDTTSLTSKNVEKLINDKINAKASLGFFLFFNDPKISKKNITKLKDNNCYYTNLNSKWKKFIKDKLN
jgi:hypothetical protein